MRFDAIRWTASTPDRRASIALQLIQRSSFGHVSCTFKYRVELSPTREKLEGRVGIQCGAIIRVSLNSDYGMLICTISLIITININMHVTSAPRRRSRGSAWRCHVALSATSHPRGPTRILTPFSSSFNCFNHLKTKINSENL